MRRRIINMSVLLAALAGSLVLLANRSSVQAWAYGVSTEKLVGKRAPELPALATLDGKKVSLEALRGKVVLLHFWTFH
jgi:hypothetical protein